MTSVKNCFVSAITMALNIFSKTFLVLGNVIWRRPMGEKFPLFVTIISTIQSPRCFLFSVIRSFVLLSTTIVKNAMHRK